MGIVLINISPSNLFPKYEFVLKILLKLLVCFWPLVSMRVFDLQQQTLVSVP